MSHRTVHPEEPLRAVIPAPETSPDSASFWGDDLGALVHARRRELGLTLQELADAAHCAKSYLSAIENNRRPSPPGSALVSRLEAALRLTPGLLSRAAAWKSTPASVRTSVRALESQRWAARRLAHAARSGSLDELYRSGALRAMIEHLDPSPAPVELPSPLAFGVGAPAPPAPCAVALVRTYRVPLINRVAAGYPTEFTDLAYPARIADEYVSVPDVSDPDAFAARVVGDSMLPDYREGDVVVFSPARPVVSGCDCFVRLEPDHESTFKRVFFEAQRGGGRAATSGHDAHIACGVRGSGAGETESDGDAGADGEDALVRLQPLNARFPPRVVERERVAGCYAAVCVIRRITPDAAIGPPPRAAMGAERAARTGGIGAPPQRPVSRPRAANEPGAATRCNESSRT